MRISSISRITTFLSIFIMLGCSQPETSVQNNTETKNVSAIDYSNIIPLPVDAKQGTNDFVLSKTTQIVTAPNQPKLTFLAGYLKDELSRVIQPSVAVETTVQQSLLEGNNDQHQIVLLIDKNLQNGTEAYQIAITENLVTLTGGSEAGVFRGIQTLKQLLPAAEKNTLAVLKTGLIKDYPRFEHRGFMLDVARYFYTVAEVKQIIDYLATYKYNVFHLHLTDDQGWRINIPSWPKLTSIGSNSAVGKTSCENCFYSLKEYEDIVQYADERFITLIPEIDVPGHVRSALASYPEELYCEGDKPEWPYTGVEVQISSLCFSNPKIYQFFDDVISEVAKRTTGKYIHIGGDETPKWVKHQDYAEFMLKASAIVTKHNKTIMGWTNDLGSVDGLSPDIVGQHWTTKKHCCETTLKMSQRGSKIVMSPANKTYLDLKYDKNTALGLDWAGHNSIENSYRWNPDTNVEQLNSGNIIGIEAALWAETITSMSDAQYMIFPRLLTLSEVAWSPQDKRSWDSFTQRLSHHLASFKQKGINYKSLKK